MEKEVRNLNQELILNEEKRTIEGYALVFDTPSDNIGGFIEIVERSAVDEDTIKRSDVLARLNHDSGKVLARSKKGKGNLELILDNKGLFYRFEAPHTPSGEECLEQVKNGVIDSSSFSFTLPKDGTGDKWVRKGGAIYHYIEKIDKIYDVSPVYIPAYSSTTCSKRCLDGLNYFNTIEPELNRIQEEIESL